MPRGFGDSNVSGRGQRRRQAQGRRTSGVASAGAGGQCICLACGEKTAHQAGVPCYQVRCPKCGLNMARK